MPKESFRQAVRVPAAIVAARTFEEIVRARGPVRRARRREDPPHGGEPLLRRDLERLVAMLAEPAHGATATPLDLTLTTNGSILARKARALKDAGRQRVTVSLDALDDAVFRRMNDADFPVADVLHGIDDAERVGLGPLKVNMVVKRGTNDHEILADGRAASAAAPSSLRFIEYMDVG
jgi:cyclic pyranopterin phosphate synthase